MSKENPDPFQIKSSSEAEEMEDSPIEEQEEYSTKKLLIASTKRVVSDRQRAKEKKFDWSSQGTLVLGGMLFFAILLYAILGSMRNTQKQARPLTDKSMLPAKVEYGGRELEGKVFVGMEAVRTDKDPVLIQEIGKVIDSKGMPSDIFQDDVPPEMNIAGELSRKFKIYQQNPSEMEKLRVEVPYGKWNIGADSLKKVADILARVEPKRQEVRQMLKKSDVCFSFEFVHDEQYGQIPDTEAVDFLGDYVLLEEFAIARALLEGKITDASESLSYIFRIVQLAAEVKNPGIRTKAAQIRRHALDIMQTVVLHQAVKETDLLYLYEMIREQLENWVPESAMWIGDRASGMKVYNLVQQYGLEEALEPEEIEELKRRDLLETVSKNLGKHLPEDQVYYLQTMQRIINESRKPLFERRNLLRQIENSQRSLLGRENEPFIAGFLLRGVRELMEICALERTECEVAFLALATSLRKPTSIRSGRVDPAELVEEKEGAGSDAGNEVLRIETLTFDPIYGKKYEIRHVLHKDDPKIPVVWVSYYQCAKPYQVPDLSLDGPASPSP